MIKWLIKRIQAQRTKRAVEKAFNLGCSCDKCTDMRVAIARMTGGEA